MHYINILFLHTILLHNHLNLDSLRCIPCFEPGMESYDNVALVHFHTSLLGGSYKLFWKMGHNLAVETFDQHCRIRFLEQVGNVWYKHTSSLALAVTFVPTRKLFCAHRDNFASR